jgi:hypothetical protein
MVMHDFDPGQLERHEQRSEALVNRSFSLRGQVFTYRANVPFSVLRGLSALGENSAGSRFIDAHYGAIKGIIVDEISLETVTVTEEGKEVEKQVEVTSHERFDRLCAPDVEFPLTLEDLVEVANWLVKEAVNRPTVLPSRSQPGQTTNGKDSTDHSSGERVVASTT